MTDRAKIANVLSIVDNAERKAERRASKPVSGEKEIVPVKRKLDRRNRPLRTVQEATSLADRERLELTRMEEAKLFSDRQLEQLGIVHPRSKNRPMVDAIRQLRTKLYSLQPDSNFTVMVCSVVPEGGGSFVALNLASAIAFDQSKSSLLIDANLHEPVLHKILKLIGRDNTPGLVDYLDAPEMGVEKIVNPSGIPRLRIIPIGDNSHGSAEHFSTQRYQQLMHDIKSRYSNRYVIVDGPSLSSSTDAKILSDICDYTVLVVPYGGVTPGTLDSLIDELDERKLAGIVINDQPN